MPAPYDGLVRDTGRGSPADLEFYRVYGAMNRHLLFLISQQTRRLSGLTQPEYDVLYLLASFADEPLRSGEIATMLAWEKSRVSHQLARMETSGLIVRESTEDDGRATWVRLTEEGLRRIAAAREGHVDAIRQWFTDHVTPEEQQVLTEVSIRLLGLLSPGAMNVAEEAGRSYRESAEAARLDAQRAARD